MSEISDIHIERIGSGHPVVFVHGAAQGGPAGGREHFAAQLPLAEQGFELILPDRPGHGRSPSRGPEDLELDAAWVTELLEPGTSLVGHSYGAAIALCAAGQRPGALSSLTLIEAPLFGLLPDDPDGSASAAQIAAAAQIPDPIQALIAFSRAAGIPRGLIGPAPSPEQAAAMGRGLQQMRPPFTWDPEPSLDAVATADVPALILTGGWSPGMEKVGDALARRLSATRLTIAAGHHFPHAFSDGQEPAGEQFNAALVRLSRGA